MMIPPADQFRIITKIANLNPYTFNGGWQSVAARGIYMVNVSVFKERTVLKDSP